MPRQPSPPDGAAKMLRCCYYFCAGAITPVFAITALTLLDYKDARAPACRCAGCHADDAAMLIYFADATPALYILQAIRLISRHRYVIYTPRQAEARCRHAAADAWSRLSPPRFSFTVSYHTARIDDSRRDARQRVAGARVCRC